MLIQILALIFNSQVYAANININEVELLQVTGIEKANLVEINEEALTNALFFEDEGFSCGLEEYTITGYKITEGTTDAPTKFEVINSVVGPTNYCGGSARYNCYTYFYLQNGQWKDLGAECDSSSTADE